jgi:fatty-acyl-CoA synthase
VNLGSIAEYWSRWRPEEVAIRWGDRDITWSELERRTAALAAGLRERGVERGGRVGILAENCPEWCELAIATFRAGGVVVPLNFRLTARELDYMVADSGCTAVAYDHERADRFAAVHAGNPGVVRLGLAHAAADVTFDELVATAQPLVNAQIERDDAAIIAYTSGTTGNPKGATLTHGNVLAGQQQWQQAEGWTCGTRLLLPVPLAFTGGFVNNFMGVYGCGGTLVLEPNFDPVRALDLIVRTPITAMVGVPVMWQGIAAAPGFAEADLSAFTSAVTGGAPVPESLLRAYQAKGVHIRQAYALTEASASVCVLPARLALEKRHSAGVPQLHTRIRIVDENDHDLPAGQVGQILVAGPQVMKGYWNNPRASRDALAGGWLHTGDLGTLDEDGLLQVVDRKNDTIISGGLNVYPAEIENVIARFPGVVEVGVFGVPHERWGETVAAAVGGADIEVGALVEHCRANLGDYKVPRYLVLPNHPLPRSGSGKVLRRALRAAFDESNAVRTSAT